MLCLPTNLDYFLKIAWPEATNLAQQSEKSGQSLLWTHVTTWSLNIQMLIHVSWSTLLMSNLFHLQKTQILSMYRLKSLAQQNPIPSPGGQFFYTKIISTMKERIPFFHLTSST